MPLVTPRRLAGAAAIPTLALALAACTSDTGNGSGGDAPELTPAQVVLSSYEGLDGESYQLQTVMTVNDVDFLEMLQTVDGEATQTSQDMYMSAMFEAMGEQIPEDPETAEMMESMFTDMHTEVILIDEVVYMQFSGGMLDAMSVKFGDDAWFTADLAELGGLDAVYEQFGGIDLGSQTETLLNELSEVEETGDGVYTGTLSGDSEVMREMMGATGAAGDPAVDELMAAAEVTITVDGDGLLETMEITFPEIEGMTMHMVSEVLEVGGDYDIAAPESGNLHSFEDFANAMQ